MDTKKLRQKILDLAIHGKLVPQDPNDEPASVLLERIREEKDRLIKEGKIKKSKSTASSDTSHYENVPFEVPEGWCWRTIKDICSKIGSGSTPRGSNYASTGIPFFRSQNVYNDGLVYDDIKYISEEVHKSMIGTEVLPKDLLLNITGGSLGRCAVVPSDFERGNVSQHVCILRTIQVLPEYLHCFIISDYFSDTMILSGSGREGLPKYSLEAMMIPIPPLAEQYRIVTSIEQWISFIDSIESSTTDLLQSVQFAKSKILDLAIRGKLVPQDANDEPASELLKRINPKAIASCDNPHYEDIPESWVECKLGDVCSFESGYAYSSEMYKPMGIPLIRISNIVDGLVNIEDCVYIKGNELSKNVQVKQGDLLIAMSGATTGKIGIYAYPNDAILNQRVGNIRVKELSVLSTGYRDLFINAIKVEIEKKAYGGAQPNISGKMICDFSFSLPPYYEQLRIVSKVNELFSKLDMIEKSLQA